MMKKGQIILTKDIGPRERLWVETMIHAIFKPREIYYRGERGLFKICDIACGRNSQCVNNHEPISAEFFTEEPKTKTLMLEMDTMEVGMQFRMLVENVANRRAAFEVIVTGDEVS